MENQIESIQKLSMEKKLIFKIEANNNIEQKGQVVEICTNLSNGSIVNINTNDIKEVKSWNPRYKNFIVSFQNKNQVYSILKNTHNLKNTNISIQKDYPASVRRRRARLLHVRKLIKQNRASIKAVVKDDRLYVEDIQFSWDDISGLRHGNMCGFDKLSQTFGFSENYFINCLPSSTVSDRKLTGNVNQQENDSGQTQSSSH